ncbi:glycosyltransferase family 2 protein [Photobacterium aphoticum]|uniref:Glycosyltransferase 2-like domain-containing protein n=1 Tax=Photobacterium aphoticum TaxID=754436 RepID=A0A0J1GKP1_9GAMM|nr:glycosyltransferase family 2 protein [Photobacterium aphoticum]KLV00285.1 hypothetical protein ABT58_13010 [Photobacterium aphoticum]PSU59548.1 glycosyltransferase family 2 protein [Photobacterium aphoticum]GHA39821.1 rhamnosyltransferase [Photobacterium aphoticum]
MHQNIDIVLATYNGEQFLEEQIQSIQNCVGYANRVSRLIVVDDGSTDQTKAIVERLQTDSKIEWHLNQTGKKGAKNNFEFGLYITTAEYIMLSDQDDVWQSQRIEDSFHQISSLAQSKPALVFSDKEVVDESLNTISDSFFAFRGMATDWHTSLEQLIQQNVASGCTMMFNRALLEQALPIAEDAFMHDWWLILVARVTGEVRFIEKPLIRYRQHDFNTIGAKSYSWSHLLKNFQPHLAKFAKQFWQIAAQAEVLSSRFKHKELDEIAFTKIRTVGYLKRLSMFISGDVRQHNRKGQLALLMTLLMTNSRKGKVKEHNNA